MAGVPACTQKLMGNAGPVRTREWKCTRQKRAQFEMGLLTPQRKVASARNQLYCGAGAFDDPTTCWFCKQFARGAPGNTFRDAQVSRTTTTDSPQAPSSQTPTSERERPLLWSTSTQRASTSTPPESAADAPSRDTHSTHALLRPTTSRWRARSRTSSTTSATQSSLDLTTHSMEWPRKSRTSLSRIISSSRRETG